MRRFNPVRILLSVSAALLLEGVLFAVLCSAPPPAPQIVPLAPVERDLDSIRAERILRVAIPRDGVLLEWRPGGWEGFGFDLASRLARSLGVALEVVPVDRFTLAIRDLNRGGLDLVVTAGANAVPMLVDGPAWSSAIGAYRPMAVGIGASSIRAIGDLRGRSLVVRRFSAGEQLARRWQDLLGGQFAVIACSADLTDSELIEQSERGTYTLVLVDEARARLETAVYGRLSHSAPLGDPLPLRWAVRANALQLRDAIDRHLSLSRQSGLISDLERRYLENPHRLRIVRHIAPPVPPNQVLSPFDDLFRQAAHHTGLDWRLLAAISLIESSFNPSAEGAGGAAGLMQLMPRTAEAFGAGDPYDPDQNIQAAARHLKWMADQLLEVAPEERIPFVIAAHNMGLGHIQDAQDLARRHGLDPLRWADHVATVLPLMEDPQVAATLPHGRARGSFTLRYVERVLEAHSRFVGGSVQVTRHGDEVPAESARATH